MSTFLLCISFAFTGNCTAATPIDLRLQHHATYTMPLEDSCYRCIMDNLVCLTVTKPDMAHALHRLSQFVSAILLFILVICFMC